MDVRVGPYRKLSAKELMLWNLMLEKTLESPLDSKEIQPVHPKGNQFSSVQLLSHVQLFVTPWTACQASLSIINSWSLLRLMSIKSVMSSKHLILYRPLLLLPSIFPSIRVLPNELALRIMWPKY